MRITFRFDRLLVVDSRVHKPLLWLFVATDDEYN